MDRIKKSQFSTSALPTGQRFRAWQESISVIFDVSTPANQIPGDFDASLCSYLINDQCMISRCDTTAQRFERREVDLARDGVDHYLIQAMVNGTQRVQHGNSETQFKPGSLMVIDLATHHTACTSDFSVLSLVLPRPVLAPLLDSPDSQASRVLSAEQPLVKLAYKHLSTLFDIAEHLPDTQAARLCSPTIALFAAALNGSTESVEKGPSSVARSLLMRAKVDIERNLHQNLPVEQYCAGLGISKSAMYRLFEPCGGVRAYIQERRLRRCAQMLTSPEHAHRHIYEIAYHLGFKSEAHFSRAFRQRFGQSPSEVRELGLAPTATRTPDEPEWFDEKVGDRNYEQWLANTLKS